jgi:hypothetical protein
MNEDRWCLRMFGEERDTHWELRVLLAFKHANQIERSAMLAH